MTLGKFMGYPGWCFFIPVNTIDWMSFMHSTQAPPNSSNNSVEKFYYPFPLQAGSERPSDLLKATYFLCRGNQLRAMLQSRSSQKYPPLGPDSASTYGASLRKFFLPSNKAVYMKNRFYVYYSGMSLLPNMPTHLTRHQKLDWKQIPKPSSKHRVFLISVERA